MLPFCQCQRSFGCNCSLYRSEQHWLEQLVLLVCFRRIDIYNCFLPHHSRHCSRCIKNGSTFSCVIQRKDLQTFLGWGFSWDTRIAGSSNQTALKTCCKILLSPVCGKSRGSGIGDEMITVVVRGAEVRPLPPPASHGKSQAGDKTQTAWLLWLARWCVLLGARGVLVQQRWKKEVTEYKN